MALLEFNGLTKHFGGLIAVSGLDLSIEGGEIFGLIGPNGAGKTTFFNLIGGIYKPTSGTIKYNGEDITGLKPNKIARKGIIRTFQHTTLFKEYTVLENVIFGFYLQYKAHFWSYILGTPLYRREADFFKEEAMGILQLAGLYGLEDEYAKNLSYGHQRALALAIALAAEPRVLLLDEPVAGMTAEEIELMLTRIRKINKNKGTTIVLVEHNMRAILSVCHRIAVLNFGKKIAEGPPLEVVNNQLVIEAYLGRYRDAASN
ncbi:MAG: ABC transporter ATP-binding protein [Thermodesulfobacteriota bacterium]